MYVAGAPRNRRLAFSISIDADPGDPAVDRNFAAIVRCSGTGDWRSQNPRTLVTGADRVVLCQERVTATTRVGTIAINEVVRNNAKVHKELN